MALAGCQEVDGFSAPPAAALSATPVFAPFADQAAAIHYEAEVTITYDPVGGASTASTAPLALGVPQKFRQDVVLYVAETGEFKLPSWVPQN